MASQLSTISRTQQGTNYIPPTSFEDPHQDAMKLKNTTATSLYKKKKMDLVGKLEDLAAMLPDSCDVSDKSAINARRRNLMSASLHQA